MPEEDSRPSGGIGCVGGSNTRGTHFFRHDPLEEELDPCLSAAVRYQKEKRTGFIKLRYFLCCLIVILAITLIAFALFPIFGSNHQMKNEKQRASTVNGSSQMEMEKATIGSGRSDEEQTKPTEQIEEVLLWDILELGPQKEQHAKRIVQEVRLRTGRPRPTTTTTTTIRQVQPRRKPTTTTIVPRPTTTTTTQPPRRTTTTTTKKPSMVPMPKSAHRRIRDCDYHHKIGHKSGVHTLSVDDYEFYAYCQMDSTHGWTMLQRRTNDKVPFWNATFNEYADGFGNIPDGDHWLGLESLWALADNRKMEMQIQLEGNVCKSARTCRGGGEVDSWWGIWEFTIGSRKDAYRISNLKFVRGNLSDAADPTNADMFSYLSNNERFTTVDVDNDQNEVENCASQKQRGGWWHRDCSYTTLNGQYAKAGSKSSGFYWLWKAAKGSAVAVPTYQIKPRKSSMLFRIAE